MKNLQDIKLFMLDMDGTFYLGNRLLPGAAEFIALCRERDIPFIFLTNNSSKNPDAYIEKLSSLGIEIFRNEMFTSGDATLLYLQHHVPERKLLLIGTKSLCCQFTQAGFDIHAGQPSAVVLGFDTEINYAKLTALCDAVRSGIPYIATHPDLNCPVPDGCIPDIGAVIAFVEASTGRRPDVVVGKPNRGIVQAVSQKFSLLPQQLCMVGDRLYTDIAMGQWGVQTVLVLCGETGQTELEQSNIRPDYVFDNLLEMMKNLYFTKANGTGQKIIW